MFIRSQNKKALINLGNATQIYIDDDNIVGVDFNNSLEDEYGGYTDIGTYSTEEKAIKVLDRIESTYAAHQQKYIRPVEYRFNIFNMPQEEEI